MSMAADVHCEFSRKRLKYVFQSADHLRQIGARQERLLSVSESVQDGNETRRP